MHIGEEGGQRRIDHDNEGVKKESERERIERSTKKGNRKRIRERYFGKCVVQMHAVSDGITLEEYPEYSSCCNRRVPTRLAPNNVNQPPTHMRVLASPLSESCSK